MTTQTYLKFGSLALATLVIGFVFFGGASETGSYDHASADYNKAYWSEQLSRSDAKQVYQDFLKRNAEAPNDRQHMAAHAFGELIYATSGVDGIAVCDSTFGFGCYHGFFGRAISEGGEARITELNAACLESFGPLGTGCQHGIGHGVLEYVGYDRITEALALCDLTTQAAPLLGCTSGVFMEYNTPLIGAEDGFTPSQRTLTPETMYEPCASVPHKYQNSCYYQLGQWLAPTIKSDMSKLGMFCGALAGASRNHCFMGAGEGLAFSASYDIQTGRTQCATFSGMDEQACRAGFSWALFADPRYRAQAEVMCEDDNEENVAYCLRVADLTQSFSGK